jgi:hypothetical protein
MFLSDNPNGFFLPELNWYTTSSTRRAFVSRGYRLNVLDCVAGGTQATNGLTTAFAQALANVPVDHQFQVDWAADGDYFQELGRYHAETEHYRVHGTHVCDAVLFDRNYRYLVNLEAAQREQLRRQRLYVYLTKAVDVDFHAFRSAAGVRGAFTDLVARETHASAHFGTSLQATLGA